MRAVSCKVSITNSGLTRSRQSQVSLQQILRPVRPQGLHLAPPHTACARGLKGANPKSGEVPQKIIRIYLRYGPDGEKVINKIDRVSKPGRRVYRSTSELQKKLVLGGLGVAVMSTSKGILSDRECRKENVGGEVICSIW